MLPCFPNEELDLEAQGGEINTQEKHQPSS